VPAIRAFKAKFEKDYKYISDHNGMKGYSGVYVLKAAIEKAGKLDRKAVAEAMKGLKVNTDKYPGALMYTEFDNKGDLDRMSFMVEVKNGKQEVIDMVAPLGQATRDVSKAIPAAPAAPAAKAAASKPAAKK
jgi:branched-chain amino acid transport system substrate-binding protein